LSMALLSSACERSVIAESGGVAVRQVHIAFGELPSVTTSHGGFMWVLDRGDNKIGKIDPATNEVVEELDLTRTLGNRYSSAWDLDAAGGALWVTVPDRRRFFALDPDTGDVVSTVRTRGFSTDIYVAEGSLWFADAGRPGVDLVQADPSSGKAIKRFSLGTNNQILDLVSFDGSVWAAGSQARYVGGPGENPSFYMSAHLWRIVPGANGVKSKLPLGSTYTRGAVNPVIGDVEVGPEGLWMSRNHERRVVLTSPVTGQLRKVFVIEDFYLPWKFAYSQGHLWIGELNAPRVMLLDPTTNEREIVDVGADTSFIGSGFGSVWLPITGRSQNSGEVVRLTLQ
jgi:streptogramin lyase